MTTNKELIPETKTDRLEFFSDGVFAIAITLLILEVKIPKHDDLVVSGGLYNYLLQLWPSYFAYAMSFIVIGIYWSNHHWLFSFIDKTNHVFNLLNILFLMMIAFLPFTTAILGDFILEEEHRRAAVTAYCIGFLLPIPPILFVYVYATYRHRLVHPLLSQKFIKSGTWKLLAALTSTITAIAISFYYPTVSIAIIIVMCLLYLSPPSPPTYDYAEIEKNDE